VFDDGRNGPANEIERKEPNGAIVRCGAKGYMLFRNGVFPDTSCKTPTGERVNLNGYRTEVSCSPSDFQNFQDAWETCVLGIIGEVLDPGEYINGVYLTDKQVATKKAAALRLEIWFSIKDDVICESICKELVNLLRTQTRGQGGELPFRFTKMPYFISKALESGGGGGGGDDGEGTPKFHSGGQSSYRGGGGGGGGFGGPRGGQGRRF
jgi:hypothetical protein